MNTFEELPGTTIRSQKNLSSGNRRRVLGIDPGLANTGFGVVDYFNGRYRMVSYGCITTKSTESLSERLLRIASNLQAVIDEFKPDEASM